MSAMDPRRLLPRVPDERADILLVGGGVAAVRCARQLRRDGFDGSIVMVGAEEPLPYNRPPLSKELLRGDVAEDLVAAEPEGWYLRRSIDLRRGVAVAALDPAARIATLSDGRRVAFGRCLLATGARARELSVPGAGRALVLRTTADARALRAAAVSLPAGAPTVVIGGGFIGIEVASSLAAIGLRPTVTEAGDRLWGGRMGVMLADWARATLADAGVAVRTSARVSRVDPDGVTIGTDRLDAPLVVAGIGAVPLDGLAGSAGLEVSNGVVVGDDHRTSDPAIWAAGDVARVNGSRFEHWHAARDGGARAARSMLGLPLVPAQVPWIFTEVAGIPVDIVGDPAGWDDEAWLVDGVVAHLLDRRVVRLASLGGAADAGTLRALLALGLGADEMRSALRRS